MEELRKKLKEINNQIDVNVDSVIELKNLMIEKKVRFNDWTSPLLQELDGLHKENDKLDKAYDEIKKKIDDMYLEKYRAEISSLKEIYQGKKYRVINRNTGEEIFTDKVRGYLYNFEYEIRLVLEGREYRKQGKIVNPYWWNASGDYMVETFKDNDSIFNIEKKETFTNEGELLSTLITKTKRSISVSYLATRGSVRAFNVVDFSLPSIGLKYIVNILSEDRDNLEMDIIKKAKDYFVKDKEIIELLEKY